MGRILQAVREQAGWFMLFNLPLYRKNSVYQRYLQRKRATVSPKKKRISLLDNCLESIMQANVASYLHSAFHGGKFFFTLYKYPWELFLEMKLAKECSMVSSEYST